MESLKRENSRLQSQVDHQREQLSVCQQEIEESRTMLSQLEQLAQQVQNQNKSQNVSSAPMHISKNKSHLPKK